jgi:hypothetical protein
MDNKSIKHLDVNLKKKFKQKYKPKKKHPKAPPGGIVWGTFYD